MAKRALNPQFGDGVTTPLQFENTPDPKRTQASFGQSLAAAPRTLKAQAASQVTADTPNSARKKIVKAKATAVDVRATPRPTLSGAASARTRLTEDAILRHNSEVGHESLHQGSEFYFNHGHSIEKAADQYSVDRTRAQHASGLLSAQNGPANERAGVAEMMRAHHEGTVTYDKDTQIGGRTFPAGVEHKIADMPAGTLSDLAKRQSAHNASKGATPLGVTTNVDLPTLRKANAVDGTIEKAEHVLRGNLPSDHTLFHNDAGKISTGKIPSYVRNNSEGAAKYGSLEHMEYRARTLDAQRNLHEQAHGAKDYQDSIDLTHGMKHEPQSLFGSNPHTVEDTWQAAISSQQPLKGTQNAKSSPAKAVGDVIFSTGTGPNTHAAQNKATRMAADDFNSRHGTRITPQHVQELGWDEARIQAGKSPEYDKRTAANQASAAAPSRSAHFAHGVADPHQGQLF